MAQAEADIILIGSTRRGRELAPLPVLGHRPLPPSGPDLLEPAPQLRPTVQLWLGGFPAPKGSVYVAVESPRGELGVFLEGDGGPKPYRVHYRTPSFTNLQILETLSRNHLVADLVALIGTIDVVLGDVDR